MSRGGKYSQKPKAGTRIIYIIILLLLVILVLFFISIGASRNNQESAAFAQPEISDTVQAAEQTFLTEESMAQPQIMEPTEGKSASVSEAAETEARTETIAQSQGVDKAHPEEIPEGYDAVLQQYREVIGMDPSEFNKLHGNETEMSIWLGIESLQDMVDKGEVDSIVEILERPTLRERYPYVDGSTLSSAKMYSKEFDPSVYHYAYYNIDGKHSTEMLIGEYIEYRDEYEILAIYTYSYDGPRLLTSISDNARWHLTIYTDGTYCVDGSGGAALHHWNYYQMHETFDLNMIVASFDINYDAPRSEYMASVIREYEAMLTPVEDIVWHPLVEGL